MTTAFMDCCYLVKMRKFIPSLLPHIIAWVLAYSFFALITFLIFLDDENSRIRDFGLLQIVLWGVYVGVFIGLVLGIIDQIFLKRIKNIIFGNNVYIQNQQISKTS